MTVPSSLMSYHCRCCCYRLADKGRSIAPLWPRLTARLQRSAGGRLLSVRCWSTNLLQGRSGRCRHWLLGGRPSDRLMWQLSALWAGTSSGSLATWPKRALRRWLMVSEMDGRHVVAEMSSFRMNWCHLICSSCLWHFIWKASRALESVERRDQVSAAHNNTDCTRAW